MADHEISCILRSDRAGVHERISQIGGVDPADGKRWNLSQAEAIHAIQAGRANFYVMAGGKAVPIVVGTSAWGSKYLKAQVDREQPSTLLNLPDCPYF